MKRSRYSLPDGRRVRVLSASLLALAVVFSACGGEVDPVGVSANPSLGAMADTELGTLLTDLTEPLGLSEDQYAQLVAIGDEYSARIDEPGILWYVAADIQRVLTSAQIGNLAAERTALREQIRDRIAERFAAGGPFGGRMGGFGSLLGGGMRGGPGGPLGAFFGGDTGPDCAQVGEAVGGRFGDFGAHDGIGAFLGPRGGLGGLGRFADLELSEDQLAALEAIALEFAPQFMDLMRQRRDGILSEEEFRELAEALGKEFEAAIREVLSDEQIALLEEGRERAHEAREAARAARLDVLGLTEQQLEELEALRSEFAREVCETVVSGGAPEDLRARHQAALAEILSGTQLEIIEVHRSLALHFLLLRLESDELSGGFGF